VLCLVLFILLTHICYGNVCSGSSAVAVKQLRAAVMTASIIHTEWLMNYVEFILRNQLF